MRVITTYDELHRKSKRLNYHLRGLWAAFVALIVLYGGFIGYVCLNGFPQLETLWAVGRITTSDSGGSAFVVDSQRGYALSAARLFDNTPAVRILFPGQDFDFNARVLFRDDEYDLALLQIQGDLSNYMKFVIGDSDFVEVGDKLRIIGYPMAQWTVTEANLKNRDGSLLEISAPNEQGYIGSPLVYQEYNTVVGIIVRPPTAQLNHPETGKNNFALPINQALEILKTNGYNLE